MPRTLRVRVDYDRCTGVGACEQVCPEVFFMRDDGLPEVLDTEPHVLRGVGVVPLAVHVERWILHVGVAVVIAEGRVELHAGIEQGFKNAIAGADAAIVVALPAVLPLVYFMMKRLSR